ncbi:hypothetical protein [Aurantibacillus circumpalustris]|uniref:hypothetical protein n=1 Tax=Aurantibacillus circumpalustris TaxID=3036359 RepID=UPI00295A996B|nr:hypothetical protein [Aurantibacillus circumpalustris]
MKNLFLTLNLLICFSLFTLTASASKKGNGKKDSLSCLKIEGKIINADEQQGDCIVELIGLHNQIDTVLLKEGKTKFKFILNKDAYYAIRISKTGYISKVIGVNTEILTEVNGIYRFEFETSLIDEAILKSLNPDALDFPIAIVHFDYEKDCFSYNKEYTASIKKQLHTKRPSNYRFPMDQSSPELPTTTWASAAK